MPGFTKFDWPSSLLERRSGSRLIGVTNATPVEVRRMPSASQKLKSLPAKCVLSTMESKPRAVPSVRDAPERLLESPDAEKKEARQRAQSLSLESSSDP